MSSVGNQPVFHSPSSINHQLAENIFTLNLGTYPLLQIKKRGIKIIFSFFLHENICFGYSLEAPHVFFFLHENICCGYSLGVPP